MLHYSEEELQNSRLNSLIDKNGVENLWNGYHY